MLSGLLSCMVWKVFSIIFLVLEGWKLIYLGGAVTQDPHDWMNLSDRHRAKPVGGFEGEMREGITLVAHKPHYL